MIPGNRLVAAVFAFGAAALLFPACGAARAPVMAGGSVAEAAPQPSVAAAAADAAAGAAAPWRERGWIVAENAKPGTNAWRLADKAESYEAIRGFAGTTSVAVGERFTLFVSSAAAWHVEAYRVGWYGGTGGREVWRSGDVAASVQPALTTDPVTNMREAQWSPSLELAATDWPPGTYLLKLVNPTGASYVPITVRDDESNSDFVVINGVTTWQAYNAFGGASLYDGKGAPRSSVVSFDRPHGGTGAGEFLDRERSFVLMAERYGYDVTYLTDIDVHLRPAALTRHRAVVSLGHDEYYSTEMRQALVAARDGGVNLAFLGANAVWRKVRFEPSGTGPLRRMVNYRTTADPMAKTDPAQLTVNWSEPPFKAPSSQITGGYTECTAVGDWVVTDASTWFFAGTGLQTGTVIKGLVGHEFDRVRPELGLPGPTQVFSRSPMKCQDGRQTFADSSYSVAPSGAGILNAGTLYWARNLAKPCSESAPPDDPCRIQRLVRNVLDVFASGPAGRTHPAQDNLASLAAASKDGASGAGSGKDVAPPAEND